MKVALLTVLVAVLAACTGSSGGQGDDSSGSARPASSARAGGLQVDLETEDAGDTLVLVRLRVRDDDGGGPGYTIRYGDGRQDSVGLAVAACVDLKGSPVPPARLDRVIEKRHQYYKPGTYSLTAEVVSTRLCTAVPTEKVSVGKTVTVR